MASSRRGGRLNSPSAGVAARRWSSSFSVSAAAASRRARKGLFLAFIPPLPGRLGVAAGSYIRSDIYAITIQPRWRGDPRRRPVSPIMGISVANDFVASMVFAIWLYLLAGRGGFWLARQRDEDGPKWDGPWPAVAA